MLPRLPGGTFDFGRRVKPLQLFDQLVVGAVEAFQILLAAGTGLDVPGDTFPVVTGHPPEHELLQDVHSGANLFRHGRIPDEGPPVGLTQSPIYINSQALQS